MRVGALATLLRGALLGPLRRLRLGALVPLLGLLLGVLLGLLLRALLLHTLLRFLLGPLLLGPLHLLLL